ncbi:MAG TPA: HEAT repeat domain-containing protein [Pirellulales bacterium]|jgi:hypothetical protein
MKRLIGGQLFFVLAFAGSAWLRADTFLLTNGGQVEGATQNTTETPRTRYVIKTSTGEVTLRRDQVKEVHRTKPSELHYIKLRPQYPDTVEGQLDLATFCRNQQLTEQATRHLERVIELDPENAKARQALGYAKIDGEWKTREERFQDKGYIKDKSGKYRMPQQVEEIERKRAFDKAVKTWTKDIKRWREWLGTNRTEEAMLQLQKIAAPEAVEPLGKLMQKEQDVAVRRIYIDALARIGTPEAWRALTIFALDDSDDDLRQTCLDYLEKQTNTGAVAFFIKRMKSKNADNQMVNRAGFALGRMRDASSIRPLIDSVVTTHVIDLPTSGNNMNPSFGNGPGGGSFSFGGGGPKQVERQFQNLAVHDALSSLTGQDFGYDQQSWLRWLATQRRTPTVDARRD